MKIGGNTKEKNHKTPESVGIKFSVHKIPTENKRLLHSWWLPQEKASERPLILVMHGWGRNMERMLDCIKTFYENGYNVIALDARNHGESDSDSFASIVKFKEDILAVINYAFEELEFDKEKVALFGHSIGGAASIVASSEDSRIKSCVTAGAFAHPGMIMKKSFKDYNIPYFPFVWALLIYIEKRIGQKFDDIAPMNRIAKTHANTLLLHGTIDKIVPFSHGKLLYNSSDKTKTSFISFENYGHSNLRHHPDFQNHTLNHFQKTL